MEKKPVNSIETNGNLIRVNDRTSEIKLTLKDINGDNAKLSDQLTYFYLTNDNKHLYEVTEYSIDDNIITFKMPPVPRGLFRIEIKDSNGVIYPSGDDIEITVKISLEDGINTAYFTYQDIVTNHVEQTALKYIDEHPEKFKGQDGKDGIDGKDGKDGLNGRNGKDGIDGKDGLNGLNGRDGVDGQDGKDGVDGQDGKDGVDGQDGKDSNDIIDVEEFGVSINNDDNTSQFNEAIQYAIDNNVTLLINKDYKVNNNIDNFHAVTNNHKIRLKGKGSIERNDIIHYIEPNKTQKTTIFVGDNNHYLNDGLTRDKPVAFVTALYYLKHLGTRSLQGNWEIKFIGHINQRGARNLLLDLPYFANPLILSGERDENNQITSIIDGEGIIDNYWWYNDHGTGYQKYYIFEDLKFINWRNHSTSSGAIVVWGGSDVIIRNCEADNVGRLGWIRKGHTNCSGNKVSNSYTGFTLQYHTDLNISNNTFTDIEGNGVHLGRNSAGHVNGNIFNNCNIDIEATQSSRLRTYDNEHNDWRLTAVNISLNATWEGQEDDNFNTVSTLDKPNFRSFYGSMPPSIGVGSNVARNVSEFYSPIKNYNKLGISNDFTVPMRVPNDLFSQKTLHINIKMGIVLNAESNIDIIFSKALPDYKYVDFNIKNNSTYVGRGVLEIDIHKSSDGLIINYRYPISGGYNGNEVLLTSLDNIYLNPENIHRLYFNIISGGIAVRYVNTTVSI